MGQTKSIDQQDQLKQAAAQAAVNYIEPHLKSDSVVGVGTGSTANYFIDALAKHRHKFDAAVASSRTTQERLESHGIRVFDLNAVKELNFYIDGADEANPNLELIKGGGGALTREKIVAAAAQQFICIVDGSKMVSELGAFPLPIEVIPMARSFVARKLVGLGGRPTFREGFLTDNGNLILDVHGLSIGNPVELENQINNITGVVTNGLFAQRSANVILLATADGVEEVHR